MLVLPLALPLYGPGGRIKALSVRIMPGCPLLRLQAMLPGLWSCGFSWLQALWKESMGGMKRGNPSLVISVPEGYVFQLQAY